MEERTAGHIIQMGMNHSEESNRGRSRSGFHVFLSRFFGEFKVLLIEEKWERLIKSGVSTVAAAFAEEESVDSTDSRLWAVSRHGTMKYGCHIWNNLDPATQEAWKYKHLVSMLVLYLENYYQYQKNSII